MAGVLPFLRAIDLTKNNFHDDFPRAVENMTSLVTFRANKTQLMDVPDSITKLNKLEDLILSRNEIKEIPQEITDMAGLRSLNLRHNKLQKEGIPYSLFDLEELTTLDFSHNNLDSCPENLHRAKALLVLNVAHNRIKEVPPSLFTQLKYIQHLDLSNNLIEYIPPQIRRLQQLKSLNISYNPLQHDQFRSLSGLTQLESLNIAYTQRGINNIPSEFDKLENLTDIDLSYNKLTRVPEPVYRLERLKRANFSHNEISEMSSLTECWTELITLNLTDNNLSEIPACICKLTKLKRLFLNGNKITFEGVPSAIGKLQNLEVFMAARNLLACIPDSLCKCSNLRRMDLGNNQLLTLPPSIWDLKQLQNLNTDDNPSLVMPDKPAPEVKGSGAEFYNVDFSLYNQRKVAGLKPPAETMPQKDKEAERKKLRARLRIKQAQLKAEEEGGKDSTKFIRGLSEYKEDVDSVSTYMSSRSRLTHEEEQAADVERREIKNKKWTDALTKPSLDYTDLFPEIVNGHVGQEEGLFIWRIDQFQPLLLDDAVGRFYEADCYIILNAYAKENLPGLIFDIHFWIGSNCEIDKKACAAIHAVHLRNMLGCDNRTIREEQGEETDEFILLFDGDIEVLEGGSESGFYPVEEMEYTKRLYKCHGQNNIQLEPVEIHVSSIDHRHSYLLDDGMVLVVWQGKLSKLTQQKKATLFAEKINKTERKNQAKMTVITKYETEKDYIFYNLLEGNAEDVPVPDPDSKVEAEDNYVVPIPKLYEVHLGIGYLDLKQLEFTANRPMTHLMLKTQRVYLLDAYTDVFVWIGAHTDKLLRNAAYKLSGELLKMITRPGTAIVNTNFEGVESALFRSFFHKWDNVVAVDFTRAADKVIAGANRDGQEEMKVDLTAIFTRREPPMVAADCVDFRDQWKENLESMSCFVMEGKNFTRLPAGEQGHFYTENCYIFLCTYWMFISDFNDDLLEQYVILQKKQTGKKRTEDVAEGGGGGDFSNSEEEEEEEALVCRVYFWQGRDASKVCWPQYSLSSFRTKIREKIGSKMPVEDERCFQQQENLKFLSYFNGKFIIHKGKRPTNSDPAQTNARPRLYQVRQNGNILAQRCVEIGCSSLLLNSAFCYVLKVPAEKDGELIYILYVWIGSRSSEELMNASIDIGKEAFDDVETVSVLYEGTNEPDIYWASLRGRKQYDTHADWMDSIRLFRCSNERGYFAVSEKCSDFCQDDLSDEDVMILDSGSDVFVWIGEESSDVERKLALKSAQLYQQHVQDLSGEARKLSIVRRGKENLKFIKLFHGWGPFRARTKNSS